MNIEIQTVHFDADKKLIELIEKKVNKLETFFDKIISAEVYLQFEEESSNIKDKVAEVKLYIPGTSLFAKERSKLFEESVDMAVSSVKRQLIKHKEKMQIK